MAPKHSLGLFRLRATSTSSLRRQRRLAGCAGAQFADSASVVVEDAPCRQHLLQSSEKSAVDSADSRQLQMVCDRDRDRETLRRFVSRCNCNYGVCVAVVVVAAK